MNIIKKETIYKGFFDIQEFTVEAPSGALFKRVVMVRKNAVAALVYDTVRKVFILTKQWRPGSATDMVEIVAGVLDHEDEDKEQAIGREIGEEIGYRVDTLRLIDDCYLSPGGSTESITTYYAEVSNKIGSGGGLIPEYEYITVVSFTKEKLLSLVCNDAKTIIAINFVRNNPERFV